MTSEKKYPLLDNLEKVKNKPFKTLEEQLYAIVNVLDEEALTRWKDDNSETVVPVELRRQSLFRWDVAGSVFGDTNVIHLIRKKQASDMVTKSHLLCVTLGEVFYDLAASLFYQFYGQDTGNGLTACENNEIITTIFGEQFNQLDKAFEDWLVGHVANMLIAHPDWNNVDLVAYTNSQIDHYRNTYEGAFFMPHIEKAIQNITAIKV